VRNVTDRRTDRQTDDSVILAGHFLFTSNGPLRCKMYRSATTAVGCIELQPQHAAKNQTAEI